MKHFLDCTQDVSRQTFDMAIILDNKGKKVGKIIVRYTNAQIGYNNQTAIIFHGMPVLNESGQYTGQYDLDAGKTIKGCSYDKDSVFELLASIGAKVYGWNGLQFYSYEHKAGAKAESSQNVNSISRCTEFLSFKIKNNKFRIEWV